MIRPASPDDLVSIDELIAASRAVWKYDPSYAEASLPLLRVDSNYLAANCAFVIGDFAGFFALVEKDEALSVDHLWIAPHEQRSGFGRAACEFIDAFARAAGHARLTVLPDPPAEGFYVRVGYVDTGARVPSRIAGGPTFKLFEKLIF